MFAYDLCNKIFIYQCINILYDNINLLYYILKKKINNFDVDIFIFLYTERIVVEALKNLAKYRFKYYFVGLLIFKVIM